VTRGDPVLSPSGEQDQHLAEEKRKERLRDFHVRAPFREGEERDKNGSFNLAERKKGEKKSVLTEGSGEVFRREDHILERQNKGKENVFVMPHQQLQLSRGKKVRP